MGAQHDTGARCVIGRLMNSGREEVLGEVLKWAGVRDDQPEVEPDAPDVPRNEIGTWLLADDPWEPSG